MLIKSGHFLLIISAFTAAQAFPIHEAASGRIGEGCSETIPCKIEHTVCVSDSTCKCAAGYAVNEAGGACLPTVGLGEKCNETAQCDTMHSVCSIDHVCKREGQNVPNGDLTKCLKIVFIVLASIFGIIGFCCLIVWCRKRIQFCKKKEMEEGAAMFLQKEQPVECADNILSPTNIEMTSQEAKPKMPVSKNGFEWRQMQKTGSEQVDIPNEVKNEAEKQVLFADGNCSRKITGCTGDGGNSKEGRVGGGEKI